VAPSQKPSAHTVHRSELHGRGHVGVAASQSGETPAPPLLLEHARILTPLEELRGPVLVSGAQIAAVGDRAADHSQAQRLDLHGYWLVPGFIDLHVHGGGGAQFTHGNVEECRQVTRFHARHGTTALLATTVAASREALSRSVAAISRAASSDDGSGAELLGCHLEGPFLNPRRCGAMSPHWMRAPDRGELISLIHSGRGCVRMVAMAPELTGALELVRLAVAEGVVVAVGHSDATYRQAHAAFDAGARHAIHLFNAMRPLHHREPGIVGAALDRGDVTCELIADGQHVHPATMRLVSRVKGSTAIALVTDAIAAAGMPDGTYRLGDADIEVTAGRAGRADGPSLAGSTLTMDAAVRGAVTMMDVPLSHAVTMATVTPARVLGLEHIGRIAPGYRADLTVLSDDLRAVATMRGGRFLDGPPPPCL
jgi:N-acetylglucosamine-6-phosphate deacetylase